MWQAMWMVFPRSLKPVIFLNILEAKDFFGMYFGVAGSTTGPVPV